MTKQVRSVVQANPFLRTTRKLQGRVKWPVRDLVDIGLWSAVDRPGIKMNLLAGMWRD